MLFILLSILKFYLLRPLCYLTKCFLIMLKQPDTIDIIIILILLEWKLRLRGALRLNQSYPASKCESQSQFCLPLQNFCPSYLLFPCDSLPWGKNNLMGLIRYIRAYTKMSIVLQDIYFRMANYLFQLRTLMETVFRACLQTGEDNESQACSQSPLIMSKQLPSSFK